MGMAESFLKYKTRRTRSVNIGGVMLHGRSMELPSTAVYFGTSPEIKVAMIN